MTLAFSILILHTENHRKSKSTYQMKEMCSINAISRVGGNYISISDIKFDSNATDALEVIL